jgi:hypothetical protein
MRHHVRGTYRDLQQGALTMSINQHRRIEKNDGSEAGFAANPGIKTAAHHPFSLFNTSAEGICDWAAAIFSCLMAS